MIKRIADQYGFTVIARRVGLEALDYKQILVDKYRCDPDMLGEVRMVNGRLDVEGSVDLSSENLIKLPFKFGKVGGSFFCDYNRLTSLEGAPREVGGSFYCRHNKLASLEGAPLEVGDTFNCSYNQLTSLEGAPRKVDGNFRCYENNLPKDVKKPKGVKGKFYASVP